MSKQLLKIIFAIIISIWSFSAHGQTTYKEAKKILKSKAIKEARKEAKKWIKMGYTNLPGDPPLEKQFEASMIKQFMLDEKGDPVYIITMGSAIAGTEGVAAANAMDNARGALAGQIQSEVSALVSNNKANTQYEDEEVETIDEFISNSKTLIQQELGPIKPAIRMYRKTGNNKTGKNKIANNIEYRYSTAYSLETAKNITKRIMKENLAQKMDTNENQINELLDL